MRTRSPLSRPLGLLVGVVSVGLVAACSTPPDPAPAAAAATGSSSIEAPSPAAGSPSGGAPSGSQVTLPSAHVHAIARDPRSGKLLVAAHDGLYVYDGVTPWASIHIAGGFAAGKVADTAKAALMAQIDGNLVSCFLCCRAAVNAMKGGGRIVNVAARPALEWRAGAGMRAYTVAKAGVAFVNVYDFKQQGQPTKAARSVEARSSDSGLFWFFAPNNWEAQLKILDGCGLNQKYWVFISANTNVQFTVTVFDTQTGNSKTYSNPQGKIADPVADTSALACS